MASMLVAGACTTVRLEAPSEPIQINVDVVVRELAATESPGIDAAPSDPAARERLIRLSLRNARIAATADRALLLRAREDSSGDVFLDTTHEVAGSGEAMLRDVLQDVLLDVDSFEGATLATGKCYFRYVDDFEDLARIKRLREQVVTALAACPVILADGRLAGVVSVNWDHDQTVDQEAAHVALSEAANTLSLLLADPSP